MGEGGGFSAEITPELGMNSCGSWRGRREDDGMFGKRTKIDKSILLAVVKGQPPYLSSIHQCSKSRIKISIERRRGLSSYTTRRDCDIDREYIVLVKIRYLLGQEEL